MANVIVDLQSLIIEADEAVVNAYMKGNDEATKEIHNKVFARINERITNEPWSIIEGLEVDDYIASD